MTLGGAAEWGHGGVTYPLVEATSNSLLEDADPTLFLALDYFAAALDLHLGGRLRAEAHREGIQIQRAVATKLPFEPTPAILADNFLFPLFALYRTTVTVRERTIVWNEDVSEWGFAYVLPALTPVQTARIGPILRSVERSLAHATRQGYEPVYKNGAHIWSLAKLSSIRLKDVRYEPFNAIDQQNGTYRAITGTFEVVERNNVVEGAYEAFSGAHIAIDHKSAAGDVEPLVEAFVHPRPTLSYATPNNGTKLGGTAVVVTGTNFRTPMMLKFDSTSVEAIVTSPTTASAISPPHPAFPTAMVDLSIIAADGQSARLPAGFTYTTP